MTLLALLLFQAAPERPLLRDLMGLNGHTVQFKPELYAPTARLARDYHPVDWDLGGDTAKLPDFPYAKNRVDWSAVYGSWKKHGWDVNACLIFDTMPPKAWKDPAKDLAAYAGAFARAFGPGSARPLVDSVEIGNEPGQYDDATYRAMFEAAARAVRAADPKLRIATCNVADEKSGDYHKSVSCVDGLADLYIFEYVRYPGQLAWAVWSPTGSGRAVDKTLEGLPGPVTRAERLALKAGPPEAVVVGAGPLRVDESPVFMWFR